MASMIRETLSSNSKISSKRVITIVAFGLMASAFIGDLGWNLTVAEHMYDAMSYIVIAGLGFTASEWLFSGKSPKDSSVESDGGYDKGYKEGYQAAKEARLSGNNETEEDMY
tara:strand:+ start:1687 stop:2022 length:336 start_codon:yes stop_codon:yes gene_type:complete